MYDLYTDLKDFLRKYVHAPESEIGLLAQYAIATHCYEDYQCFPILHIQGDSVTGKNRRLDLLKYLSYNPKILLTPSTSSLMRTIDEKRGTIMIDEADSILNFRENENIFLAGYKRGAKTSRSMKDPTHNKGFRTVEFELYCPKVLVTRNGIENDALISRCITIITLPKPANSNVPHKLPKEAEIEGKKLKEKISTLIKSKNINKNGGSK